MILIITGVSGAGKTTVAKLLAQQLQWPFYEGDDFHPAANIQKMKSGHPLNDEDRIPWLESLRKRIEKLIAEKQSAVVTCSALKESYRKMRSQFEALEPPKDAIIVDATKQPDVIAGEIRKDLNI